MKLSGAEIVCESLLKEGVDIVFGLPGGAVLPLYGAMAKYPDLRHVLVRHEQAAAMAADGYARATGRVGVCSATSGPGATNLVTGIATAQMDSVPLVAITGQVPRAAIGRDAFQETDVTGITLPITKHNYLVLEVEDIAPCHQGGVPHRPHRTPRACPGGHTEGRSTGPPDGVCLARQAQSPRLPSARRGLSGTGSPRRSTDQQCEAASDYGWSRRAHFAGV